MEKRAPIYVAGHRGMVGSAIVRALEGQGFTNLIYASSKELDLRDPKAVNEFFKRSSPEFVFLAAAHVGGILANDTYSAEFLYDNLMIEANVIQASYTHKIRKLLFLGSSCIYPKFADQPMKEESLLTGLLEPTNEAYAVAKIAGIKLCDAYRKQYGCDFISAMPTNLYGPNDNYDLHDSHVLPALIRRFHEAKEKNAPTVTLWGTGKPLREFMHVDDVARACLFLMEHYDQAGHINVGSGEELSIKELGTLIAGIVGYKGKIEFDASKPDGTARKLMDSSRLHALGFRHQISLEEGIRTTYKDFLEMGKRGELN